MELTRERRAHDGARTGPRLLIRLLTDGSPIHEGYRFWSRVAAPAEAGCWLWTGSRTRDGFGLFFKATGSTVAAHRWAFVYCIGPLPPTRKLWQRCGVRLCVNPWHMCIGPRAMRRESAPRPYLALGVRLRAVREEQGRTRRDVAGAAGIYSKYLGLAELGYSRPSDGVLHRLAATLGMDAEALMRVRDEG